MLFFKIKTKKEFLNDPNKQIKKKIKREEFIKEIENIIQSIKSNSKIFNLVFFQKKLEIILKQYNCNFGYQNSNSKKHGHLKEKINLKTNQRVLELKIEKNENIAGKIYTIIHELTHLINNHLHSKSLTNKQKEVVADTTALMFIKYINLYEELLKSNMSKKWDIKSYSKNYINSMTFSEEKKEKIKVQITSSYDFLVKNLLE